MLGKPICNITPFTLLDYPHKSACILWYAGCNMRCLYCYNPEIVFGKGTIGFDEVISFLKTRIGLLDAVVFSGGECLMHKAIYDHIKEIKNLGFSVKIDTNGTRPLVLERLINEGLVDYVALDYKATEDKFEYITQSALHIPFEKSLDLLLNSAVKFEVRTTLHSDLLNPKDITKMINSLEAKGYQGNYYIQYFRNQVQTLGNLPSSVKIKESEIRSTSKIEVVYR